MSQEGSMTSQRARGTLCSHPMPKWDLHELCRRCRYKEPAERPVAQRGVPFCGLTEEADCQVCQKWNPAQWKLWDLRNRRIVCEYKGHTETTGACVFVPSSCCRGMNIIATCSNDCTVRLWDQNSQACLSCLTLPGSGTLTSLAAFDNGSLCVSSFNTGIHLLQISHDSAGAVTLSEKARF